MLPFFIWGVLMVFNGFIHCTLQQEPLPGTLPPPFDTSKSFTRRPGVYIEKWEGIDSIKVSSLKEDSRFPYMPTYRTYGSMFTQPDNWGENFATRIRAYFVPKVTGPYTFYISSDNEGQLWFSKDMWPQHKSKIAWIEGEQFSRPAQYNKYLNQKSWPVFLEKGNYYYMETLMKEYYDDDTFSVAVQLPGQGDVPKGPIRGEFLWTDIPRPNATANSVTDQVNVFRIASAAGAKAGSTYGQAAAAKSAAVAGATAGRIAGLRAGAFAAKLAAAAAAREVFAKAFNATFAAYGNHLKGLDVRLFNLNGNTLSKQIPLTNTTDTSHVYNVHINQYLNRQMSFPNHGTNPKYLPATNNQGPAQQSTTNPVQSSTEAVTNSVELSLANNNYSVQSPQNSNTPPSAGYLPGTNANMGPSPLYVTSPYPGSAPGIINANNIGQVQGSSGQVLKKIQYVQKPNYYKYHGPAKGLKQPTGTAKKSTGFMQYHYRASQAQSRETVQRAFDGNNPLQTQPVFTPLYPSGQDGERRQVSQTRDTDVGQLNIKNTDQSNVWPTPVFTPLDTQKTDQGATLHSQETVNPQTIDQQTTLESQENDQQTVLNPLVNDQNTIQQDTYSSSTNRRNLDVDKIGATVDPMTQFSKDNYQDYQQNQVFDPRQIEQSDSTSSPGMVPAGAPGPNTGPREEKSSQATDLGAKENGYVTDQKPQFESLERNSSKETESYNLTQATREDEIFVYYPKLGEDADEMARKLVYDDGCASKIVFNARYRIHSLDIPALQLNISKNSCVNSFNGEISLRPFCQYFYIREGLLPRTDSDDISLESACIPDHFLSQRNYRFHLLKRDGTMRFAREATFAFYKTISFPSSLQIMSFSHYLWFVCESKYLNKVKTQLILEYIRSGKNEFERCSFSFIPLPEGTNQYVNCKAVLDHSVPELKGSHMTDNINKETAVPKGAACLALNFINKAGKPFQVFSDIKNNKYLVKNSNLKIKTIIKRPDLHNHVTYRANSIDGDDIILLNGLTSLTVLPQRNCDEFVPVEVTSKPVKPVVVQHNHYHYHNAPQSPPVNKACPPPCSRPPPCPTSCPLRCCKRNNKPT